MKLKLLRYECVCNKRLGIGWCDCLHNFHGIKIIHFDTNLPDIEYVCCEFCGRKSIDEHS